MLTSPKGATSSVWIHFGFEVDENGAKVDEKKHVVCRIYKEKVGYSRNTTNL